MQTVDFGGSVLGVPRLVFLGREGDKGARRHFCSIVYAYPLVKYYGRKRERPAA